MRVSTRLRPLTTHRVRPLAETGERRAATLRAACAAPPRWEGCQGQAENLARTWAAGTRPATLMMRFMLLRGWKVATDALQGREAASIRSTKGTETAEAPKTASRKPSPPPATICVPSTELRPLLSGQSRPG